MMDAESIVGRTPIWLSNEKVKSRFGTGRKMLGFETEKVEIVDSATDGVHEISRGPRGFA